MVKNVGGLRRFCPYEPPVEKKSHGVGKVNVFAALVLGGVFVAGLSWWSMKRRGSVDSVVSSRSDVGGVPESAGLFVKKVSLPVPVPERRVPDVDLVRESWPVGQVPVEGVVVREGYSTSSREEK